MTNLESLVEPYFHSLLLTSNIFSLHLTNAPSSHLLSQSTLPLIIANQSSSLLITKRNNCLSGPIPPVTIQRKWRPPSSSLSVVTRFLHPEHVVPGRGAPENIVIPPRSRAEEDEKTFEGVERSAFALSLSDNTAGQH